jgi:autotransporter-associated beta strand protein
MTTSIRNRRLKQLSTRATPLIFSAVGAAFAAADARGATLAWNGSAADLAFKTPGNWDTGVLPGSIDIAQFRETGYDDGATVTISGDLLLGRLAFNFTSTNVTAKNLTITGGTITLGGTGSPPVGINRQNTVSGVQTVNSNLLLGVSQQWNVAGNGDAPGGQGRLIVNGVVGETAGGAKDLTKGGGGPLELNGDNTFTGAAAVLQNTLIVGHANALGAATTPVLVGNTAANNSQSNLVTKGGVTFARDVLVRSGQTGGSRIGGDGSGATTWTGTIALNKDVIVTGGLGVATGVADFRGNFVDAADPSNAFVSAGVAKANGGTVKLSGPNNTYSGPTAVNTGTLLVNGLLATSDSSVSVAANARLGGVGRIDRPVTVATGALLAPGDGGAGTLTLGGDKTLTLADGAILEWQAGASPATSDRVSAAVVSFAAAALLRVLDTTAPDPDATYVVLSWTDDDPSALAEWSIDPTSPLTGTVSYQDAADGLPGGRVVLSNVAPQAAVPEPTALLLLPVAGTTLIRRRRRKTS